jgi:hypothetical protein
MRRRVEMSPGRGAGGAIRPACGGERRDQRGMRWRAAIRDAVPERPSLTTTAGHGG